MKFLPPRFPVFWITVLMFGIVAGATLDLIIGGLIFCVVLPAVLLGQILIRWVLRRFRVVVRRSVMIVPAVVVAGGLGLVSNQGAMQASAAKLALGGTLPSGIREMYVRENAFTDYTVCAYLRCDPESLRAILEKPPFEREEGWRGAFSFAGCGLPEIQTLPAVKDVVVYRRTDLERFPGSGEVYTDAAFSFAYVVYAVD